MQNTQMFDALQQAKLIPANVTSNQHVYQQFIGTPDKKAALPLLSDRLFQMVFDTIYNSMK